jgi:alcohol dehydrogenase
MKALVYHGPGRKSWEAARFVTHRFELGEILQAYDVFANAADTGAIKVVMTR